MNIVLNLFPFLDITRAERLAIYLHANKWVCAVVTFIGFGILEQIILTSNAFEIYLGNNLIWSTIEKRAIPTATQLDLLIQNSGFIFYT